MTAESAFHSANNAANGHLSCLATPSQCIANYPAAAPTFLDPTMATDSLAKSGYVRTLQYSQAAANQVANFCYLAQPLTLNRTGDRSSDGDNGGVVGGTAGAAACCTTTGVAITVCPAIK